MLPLHTTHLAIRRRCRHNHYTLLTRPMVKHKLVHASSTRTKPKRLRAEACRHQLPLLGTLHSERRPILSNRRSNIQLALFRTNMAIAIQQLQVGMLQWLQQNRRTLTPTTATATPQTSTLLDLPTPSLLQLRIRLDRLRRSSSHPLQA